MEKDYFLLVKFQKFLLIALFLPLLLAFTANRVDAQQNEPLLKLSKTVKLSTTECNTYEVTLTAKGNKLDRPVQTVLVIDNSSSMGSGNGSPLEYAKQAAIKFVEKFLSPASNPSGQNKVAIVTYDANAEIVSGMSNNKSLLITKIGNITKGSGTNIGAGVKKAREILQGALGGTARCDIVPNVVLLTDGVATRNANGEKCDHHSTSHNSCTRYAMEEGKKTHEIDVEVAGGNQEKRETYIYGVMITKWLGNGGELALAEDTMEQIQNTGGIHESSTGQDLSSIYESIAENMKLISKNVGTEDTVESDFTIPSDGTSVTMSENPFNRNPQATIEGGKVKWNLEEIMYKQTVNFTYKMKLKEDANLCGEQHSNKGKSSYDTYNEDAGTCERDNKDFPNVIFCIPCVTKNIEIEQGDCANEIKYKGILTENNACKDPLIETINYKWDFFVDGNNIKNIPETQLTGTSEVSEGKFDLDNQYLVKGTEVKAVLTTTINLQGGGCLTNKKEKIFTISDTGTPVLTCKSGATLEGCGTDALTNQLGNLPYSETKKTITEEQFKSAVESISNTCFIDKYEYKDSKTGTCPIAGFYASC
ncbi:MAG: hypothetical protein CSA05_03365 [Bacteroidia bacterium]|nr:MAG: hypothetical protein CSA05_03365 [Bacteroidia bacterium]